MKTSSILRPQPWPVPCSPSGDEQRAYQSRGDDPPLDQSIRLQERLAEGDQSGTEKDDSGDECAVPYARHILVENPCIRTRRSRHMPTGFLAVSIPRCPGPPEPRRHPKRVVEEEGHEEQPRRSQQKSDREGSKHPCGHLLDLMAQVLTQDEDDQA